MFFCRDHIDIYNTLSTSLSPSLSTPSFSHKNTTYTHVNTHARGTCSFMNLFSIFFILLYYWFAFNKYPISPVTAEERNIIHEFELLVFMICKVIPYTT